MTIHMGVFRLWPVLPVLLGKLHEVHAHLLIFLVRQPVGFLAMVYSLGFLPRLAGQVITSEFVSVFSYILVHSTCFHVVFSVNIPIFALA